MEELDKWNNERKILLTARHQTNLDQEKIKLEEIDNEFSCKTSHSSIPNSPSSSSNSVATTSSSISSGNHWTKTIKLIKNFNAEEDLNEKLKKKSKQNQKKSTSYTGYYTSPYTSKSKEEEDSEKKEEEVKPPSDLSRMKSLLISLQHNS